MLESALSAFSKNVYISYAVSCLIYLELDTSEGSSENMYFLSFFYLNRLINFYVMFLSYPLSQEYFYSVFYAVLVKIQHPCLLLTKLLRILVKLEGFY
jgi:hypothetical protein